MFRFLDPFQTKCRVVRYATTSSRYLPYTGLRALNFRPLWGYKTRVVAGASCGQPGFRTNPLVAEIRDQSCEGCNGCTVLYRGFLRYQQLGVLQSTDATQFYLLVEGGPGQSITCQIFEANGEALSGGLILFCFQIFAVAG